MAYGAEGIGSPLMTIWTRPRATIRRIVNTDVRYHVVWLAVMAGALSRLEARWAQPPGPPGSAAWPLLVVASVIAGAVAGAIGLYLNGALLKWSGSALGGVATYAEVRAALAWAEVPIIVALSIGILSILMGTGGPLMPFGAGYQDTSVSVSLLHAILGSWSFILLLIFLGEVHRISATRAFCAILLIGVAAAVIVLVAALIVGGLGRVLHLAVTA